MHTDDSAPAQPVFDVSAEFSSAVPPVSAKVGNDPDNPPWGVLPALALWAVSAGLLLFVPLILTLPYAVYTILVQGSPTALAEDRNLIFFSILGVIPSHLLTLLVVWFVVTGRGRWLFWKTVGWTWPENFGVWKAIGLAVVLLVVGWLITYFLGGAETQLDQIIKSSYRTRLAVAFLAAVTAPLVEELVYRGVLYSALQRVLGMSWAVIIVSLMFAGVHVLQYYNNFGVIAVIVTLSFALTIVRALSRSLLPAYVIHLVFNGIQALILVFQPLILKQTDQSEAAAFFYYFAHNFIKRFAEF